MKSILYAEAITKANSFAVKDVLPIYKKLSYEGASGKIVFDEQGGVHKEPILFIVKNSKKELYKQ